MEAPKLTTPTPSQKKIQLNQPRKIKRARLHAAILWPNGVGNETDLRVSMHPELVMLWVPGDGLIIEYKGESKTIPSANVIQVDHE